MVAKRGAIAFAMSETMKKIFLLVAIICALPMGTSFAADCDPDIKPTDSYRELSAKLRCLANEIAALKRSMAGGSVTMRSTTHGPTEMTGCVVTSSLPKVSQFYLRAGGRFCHDDGVVWLRMSPRQFAVNDRSVVVLNHLELGKELKCRPVDPTCILEDRERKQRFMLSVQPGKDAKGQPVWIGLLQRVAN